MGSTSISPPSAHALPSDDMRILRIHHLTLAVRDVAQARATFESLFGAQLKLDGVAQAFGVRTADLALGENTLQLAQPLETDSPVMRFIERRGEGIYNIALEVDDLDAAVAELRERDVRVSEPVGRGPGARSAFVAMSATHGLSIQLIELPQAPAAVPQADVVPQASVAVPQADAQPSAEEEWLPEAEPAPEAPASAPAERTPLDLTPDEWSDTD